MFLEAVGSLHITSRSVSQFQRTSIVLWAAFHWQILMQELRCEFLLFLPPFMFTRQYRWFPDNWEARSAPRRHREWLQQPPKRTPWNI